MPTAPERVRKGSYLLFITFSRTVTADVGALGTLTAEEGEYCYAGSAMNGLDQRIGRHLSKEKRMRWHIDFFTVLADSAEAFVSFERDECELADMAERSGCIPAFRRFGASDCRCPTHLFRVTGRAKKELLEMSGATPFLTEGGT
ncbi:MAG: GIY-YIG nuclease family protein [Methanomassiliicoccaceae archaeon]|jgi:Uri superfamily endonuclease|nr:GIY-YIG nuclease family protein [Methanomassiliicoccaceae archaeon]